MRRSIVSGFLVILMGGLSTSAHANYIVNGSFETGNFSSWTLNASATVVVAGGAYGYPAEDGSYYAALGTVGGLGTISQSFATTAGQSYILSYYLASNGTTPNEFRTDINGTTFFDQVNIASQSYMLYSDTFTATGSTSTLTFYERNDPSYLALDNVSVNPSAVPEPASFFMVCVGAVGILGYLRPRTNKANH